MKKKNARDVKGQFCGNVHVSSSIFLKFIQNNRAVEILPPNEHIHTQRGKFECPAVRTKFRRIISLCQCLPDKGSKITQVFVCVIIVCGAMRALEVQCASF